MGVVIGTPLVNFNGSTAQRDHAVHALNFTPSLSCLFSPSGGHTVAPLHREVQSSHLTPESFQRAAGSFYRTRESFHCCGRVRPPHARIISLVRQNGSSVRQNQSASRQSQSLARKNQSASRQDRFTGVAESFPRAAESFYLTAESSDRTGVWLPQARKSPKHTVFRKNHKTNP